jgi:hypothetical protein
MCVLSSGRQVQPTTKVIVRPVQTIKINGFSTTSMAF